MLAGFALVLGLFMAGPVMVANREPSPPRSAEVGNLEAMGQARQPTWVAALNPLLGCAGVLIGASLRRPQPSK